jgi:putative pyruvate formate lyase activating enzyme
MMPSTFAPAYLNLPAGELERRVDQAWARLEDCSLCPRDCHVNRRRTTKGAVCRSGERAVVASFGPHFGEESCLVGRHGSGTIFFSWCNLRCQFCQNCDISQLGEGREVAPEQIAAMMLDLQERGCHNINFVTPSHVVPQILAAVTIATRHGLCLPLVYNTGGYDALVSLSLLDGVVDIYMPDVKYADESLARKYSKVRNYPALNQATVKEMHRQVGDLVLDGNGVALRGLLVRHLVLPDGIAGTADIVRFLADEISPDTFLNVMDQYRPCFNAGNLPDVSRSITSQEYREAIRFAEVAGLRRLEGRGPRRIWIATE